jgi:carboxylate-amine ligase
MRIDETICFAALFQALTVKLYRIHSKNMGWRQYRTALLEENKSRAARFGVGGKLIDFGRGEEVPYTELLDELLLFVDDVVDELGSREDVYYAREIMKRGTGADRQLAVYGQRNDLRDVVDYIVEETKHGVV